MRHKKGKVRSERLGPPVRLRHWERRAAFVTSFINPLLTSGEGNFGSQSHGICDYT
jgi:hypothetical protein